MSDTKKLHEEFVEDAEIKRNEDNHTVFIGIKPFMKPKEAIAF